MLLMQLVRPRSAWLVDALLEVVDLSVIFTCREDSLETLHFDTNHYNHIVWSTPEELLEKLKNRILAVIGEGPEVPP